MTQYNLFGNNLFGLVQETVAEIQSENKKDNEFLSGIMELLRDDKKEELKDILLRERLWS